MKELTSCPYTKETTMFIKDGWKQPSTILQPQTEWYVKGTKEKV